MDKNNESHINNSYNYSSFLDASNTNYPFTKKDAAVLFRTKKPKQKYFNEKDADLCIQDAIFDMVGYGYQF